MSRQRTKWLSIGAVLLVASLSARAAEAQVRPAWWNNAWRYRALVNVPPRGPGAYRAWIFAGRRAQADGADFRVVAPDGTLVSSAVVHSTPSGRHLIVFSEPKGNRLGGAYAVYFGNAAAPAPQQPLPPTGLMLKTFEMPAGMTGASWESVQNALSKARLSGMDFWKQVFDAYNPFGPQSRYISVYEGCIDCPMAGIYKFATVSADASFLLVDDELVAKWPGRGHNLEAGRHGEMSGQKNLTAGRHAFRYVGFAFDGGSKIMAAYWTVPGGASFSVIPASAFPSVFNVPVLLTEDARQPVCAAFGAETVQYLETGEARMIAVQFTSQCGARSGEVTEWIWDFGDGLSSAERDAAHVYFLPGRYDVKLTAIAADRASDTFSVAIEAAPLHSDLDFSFARRQKFWTWVKDYAVQKMPSDQLLAFRAFLKEIEQPRKQFDVDRELDKRRDTPGSEAERILPGKLTQAQVCAVATDLAEYYREPLHNWPAAEKYYLRALDQCGKGEWDRRADLRFKLAELHFYCFGDAAKAKSELVALKDDLPKSDGRRRRLAAIRIGDIERDTGRLDAARQAYVEAESDPAFLPKEPRAVADGRFAQQIESDLRQGNGEQALATLDLWLWQFPTKRLEGLPVVLRLKALLLLKNYAEVRRQAAVYLKFAADVDSIPQVQLLAGEACAAAGDKAEARKFFQAVIENWPESPATKDAKKELEGIK